MLESCSEGIYGKLDLIRRSHFPYENALAHLNKHSFNQQKKKKRKIGKSFFYFYRRKTIFYILLFLGAVLMETIILGLLREKCSTTFLPSMRLRMLEQLELIIHKLFHWKTKRKLFNIVIKYFFSYIILQPSAEKKTQRSIMWFYYAFMYNSSIQVVWLPWILWKFHELDQGLYEFFFCKMRKFCEQLKYLFTTKAF